MKIYLVGGAVRDALLGLPIKDRDWVVVDSSPSEMLALGYKQVGADFPVFLHPDTGEEYALARIERKTGAGYLGFQTETNGVTLEQDLSRRDLTINSIAIDVATGEIIDPFDGQNDLRNGVLRHTSDAFSEDPLRVVRLARFAARYENFAIAPETFALASSLVNEGKLDQLSYERFWTELEKVVHENGLARFLIVLLNNMDGRNKIKFFRELLGDNQPDSETLTSIFSSVSAGVKMFAPADRLLMLIAAFVEDNHLDNIVGATYDMKRLTRCITLALEADADLNVETLFTFLKSAKPWGEGRAYIDFLKFLTVFNESHFENPFFTAANFKRLGDAVQTVKSEQFPEFQGKELGSKIEAARKEKIAEILVNL